MRPDAVDARGGGEPRPRPVAPGLPPDVLEHLRLDHERLRSLLDRARHASVADRETVAGDLIDALVSHETAEAVLLRPRTRATPDGHPVARVLDRQERTIGRLASILAGTDPGDDHFAQVLQRLRSAVLQHIAVEEHAEHPRLRAALDQRELEDLGRRYLRVARLDPAATPPTRGGPGASGGGAAGVFARTRELVQQALTA